ncbi:recQ-mediated genome instability 1 [Brachionus plicatilis]|uniref:RecQ-mediated genome instability protein 1 n=1 Tax=Brachionus plicatilis TaxID=10195 RepID=A0A3M7RYQ1_BRAPC|nr:recQ-mediated genome instability 1 [Brachionus plicatilis]
MTSNVQRIIEEFKRKHLTKYCLVLPDDWLCQCAEFLTEESPGKSINEYTDLIFSQLLDYDLNIIGTESTKTTFFKTTSGMLDGSFFLQLRYCIDTTESGFSLIQKLRGIISDNAQVDADNVPTATQLEQRNVKKNRMLAIYLTDGKNSITAIENRMIPILKDDLLPGVKIEISGKIPFENNVLLLEPQHVKVLGGFVEEIANLDNMLRYIEEDIANKLQNRSNREKSKTFDSSFISIQSNKKLNSFNCHIKPEKCSQPKFNNIDNQETDEDELLVNFDLASYSKPAGRINSLENTGIKRPPSTDEISKYSKNLTQINNLKKQRVNDIIEIKEENDFKKFNDKKNCKNLNNEDDIQLLQMDENNIKTNKNVRSKSFSREPCTENKENHSNNSDDFDKFLNNSFDQDIKQNNIPIRLSTLTDPTFLNLCCMKNKPVSGNLATCSHVSKCFFVKVTSLLKQFKLRWYQEILASDGIAEMNCYIDNDPLTDLLDLTCQEAKELFLKTKETRDQKALWPNLFMWNELIKKCELYGL